MTLLPGADDVTARKRALVARLLEEKGLAAAADGSVPRRSRQDEWPLSFAQQRLWFLERLQPGTPRYNTFTAVRIEGPIDQGALAHALAGVLARHEVLRGRILDVGGAPVQRIEPTGPVALPVLDVGTQGDVEAEEALSRLAAEEARRPFDLARGPLLRATLVRLAPERHVLMLSLHHVAADGWAIGVLLSDLAALYTAFREGRPSPLPALPVQYADFAAWQRDRLQGEALADLVGYWRRQLDGLETLDLPTDRPRPPVPGFAGAWCRRAMDGALGERLQRLCRAEGVTAFTVLLAAFAGLLQRWTGQDDVTVGTPVAGRERVELEGLVGCFANMLALRTNASGDPTFRELLRRVRGVVAGAFAHQELPFEQLVEELRPDRAGGRHPLFQSAFVLQHAAPAPPAVRDGAWIPAGVDNGVAKFDLTLYVSQGAEAFTAAVEYSTELFDRSTAERMLELYGRLVEAALTAPDTRLSALPLLTANDERSLLEASRGASPGSVAPVHEQVSARSREAPDRLAVQAGLATLTYGALERRANQLARHLVALGAGAEVKVAVCVERSLDLVVALLGVLKAGAAYVPLDSGYPAERLRYMLEDSGARVLLTSDRLRAGLPPTTATVVSLDGDWAAIARQPVAAPDAAVAPTQLAYLIYTSGSTGRAKGVEVEHRGLSNLVAWHRRSYEVGPSDRASMLASLSFDASVWELWPYLAAGASVHLLPEEELRSSPHRLLEWLARSEATLSFLPTPLAESAMGEPLPPGIRLRALLTGGDTLHGVPPGLPFRVLNHYGPTEATVVSTWTEVRPGDPAAPPIGRAIDGTVARVLDRRLQLAPVGVPGELYVGGQSLARGYRGRPDLTAASFVPDPHSPAPGGRLYRTGDRAVLRADGQLAFLGRADEQVKVRGFRIEPGEIEAILRRFPGVREAAVTAREDEGRPRQLVAYVVRASSARTREEELRASLQGCLPAYMVPSAFVFLESLPLSPNGKVDRRALPAPPPPAAGDEPRSEAERAVAAVFREGLGVPRVGTSDDFFALGGHSLLAARVLSSLHGATGVDLPLRALFESPTVGALAARLETAAAAADPADAPPPLRRREEGVAAPVSFAQRRLWLLDVLGAGAAYNITGALRLEGRLDVGALSRSLEDVARRHESLRTVFEPAGDEPVPSVASEAGIHLRILDLRDRVAAAREAEVLRLSAEEGARPFDLSRGPLLRATLLVLGEEEHVLLLALHHIVADGWSVGILARELAAHYGAHASGTAIPQSEPRLRYADYAAWERRWLRDEVIERRVGDWRRRLEGLAPLRLPLDRPRPLVRAFAGSAVQVAFPRSLGDALSALGREHGATLFMVLLAGFQALLHRWSGQDDVAVGSPVANRRPEVEDVVGLFVNTVVMRTDFSGDPSFRELVGRVRETTLGALAHQDVPFDVLVEKLGAPHDPARNPLVQVVFALQNTPAAPLELPGLCLRPQPLPTQTTHFDLELHVQETRDGLVAAFVYDAELFEAGTVSRMAGQYVRLLESAVSSPLERVSRLGLMGKGEEEEELRLSRGVRSEYPRESTIGE
ncbi:MAG TPA: amino acid adenylation domain-containing protein, partial [Vicinamibacteria bacterium]|nr:amino acid adenylation domain-containing protein [Vicinamibacteria bacterium]